MDRPLWIQLFEWLNARSPQSSALEKLIDERPGLFSQEVSQLTCENRELKLKVAALEEELIRLCPGQEKPQEFSTLCNRLWAQLWGGQVAPASKEYIAKRLRQILTLAASEDFNECVRNSQLTIVGLLSVFEVDRDIREEAGRVLGSLSALLRGDEDDLFGGLSGAELLKNRILQSQRQDFAAFERFAEETFGESVRISSAGQVLHSMSKNLSEHVGVCQDFIKEASQLLKRDWEAPKDLRQIGSALKGISEALRSKEDTFQEVRLNPAELFEGSLEDSVKQLISQNSQLFGYILESTQKRESFSALYTSVQKARLLHKNTLSIDRQLSVLTNELGGSQIPSSEYKLSLQNNELHERLNKAETLATLFKQSLFNREDSLRVSLLKRKVGKQNAMLNQLTQERRGLLTIIERLRDSNSRLQRAVDSQQSLRQRLRVVSASYAARQQLIQEMGRRGRLTMREASAQKQVRPASELRCSFNEPEELQSLTQRLSELKRANDELASDLAHREAQCEHLRASNEDLELRLKECEEILDEEDSLIKQSDRQLSEALADSQQQAIQIDTLTDDLASSKESIVQAEERNKLLSEENTAVMSELSTKREALLSLREQHAQLQESFSKLMSETREARDLNSLMSELGRDSFSKDQLEDQTWPADELEAHIKELREYKERTEPAVAGYRQQIEDLKSILKQAQEESLGKKRGGGKGSAGGKGEERKKGKAANIRQMEAKEDSKKGRPGEADVNNKGSSKEQYPLRNMESFQGVKHIRFLIQAGCVGITLFPRTFAQQWKPIQPLAQPRTIKMGFMQSSIYYPFFFLVPFFFRSFTIKYLFDMRPDPGRGIFFTVSTSLGRSCGIKSPCLSASIEQNILLLAIDRLLAYTSLICCASLAVPGLLCWLNPQLLTFTVEYALSIPRGGSSSSSSSACSLEISWVLRSYAIRICLLSRSAVLHLTCLLQATSYTGARAGFAVVLGLSCTSALGIRFVSLFLLNSSILLHLSLDHERTLVFICCLIRERLSTWLRLSAIFSSRSVSMGCSGGWQSGEQTASENPCPVKAQKGGLITAAWGCSHRVLSTGAEAGREGGGFEGCGACFGGAIKPQLPEAVQNQLQTLERYSSWESFESVITHSYRCLWREVQKTFCHWGDLEAWILTFEGVWQQVERRFLRSVYFCWVSKKGCERLMRFNWRGVRCLCDYWIRYFKGMFLDPLRDNIKDRPSWSLLSSYAMILQPK